MLQDKERVYFEGLIQKKLGETIGRNIFPEVLNVNEYEKSPDIVDQATLNNNRHITLLLLEKNNIKIDGFKAALERIHGGTYGICENCGERISKKRLKVIPFARFCVTCQRENEMYAREELC